MSPKSSPTRRNHSSSSPWLGLFMVGYIAVMLLPPGAYSQETEAQPGCPADDQSCQNPDAAAYDPLMECGVFMGPSTLGEDTNLGIYTGIPLKKDDIVNFPEIAIPLLFREWGEHTNEDDLDGDLWHRYIWEGPVAKLETYIETRRDASKAVFVPGIGCTVNSIMDMHNIHSTHGSKYDASGLHRSKDPGVGASTPYHHALTTASIDVEAGSELFAAYGEEWIPEIPGAIITLDVELDDGDEFVEAFAEFVEKHNDLSEDVVEGLWNATANDFPYYSQAMTTLPQVSWKQVQEVLESKEGPAEDSITRHFVRQRGKRTLEWLRENAHCQDHIQPKRSTIEQAGYGAFAVRALPKGTKVGYAPLIHIAVQGWDLFNITYPIGDEEMSKKNRTMFDLVLNYSFGHGQSSILFTPYGGMVNYINHNKEKANVRVQWPTKELVAHKPEWLTKDIEFLRNTHEKIGLSFDYVAIRDIEEGEEIFMDYGDEWEAAWKEHVANWKPYLGEYVHSSEWKETTFRTENEQEENPYPPNLITMCYPSYHTKNDGKYEFLPVLHKEDNRVYCNILDRDPNLNTYLVELEIEDEFIQVHNYKQHAIFLYDKVHSNDWHLPNAFRHEIMIPDDIFPDTWRNGRQPSSKSFGVATSTGIVYSSIDEDEDEW